MHSYSLTAIRQNPEFINVNAVIYFHSETIYVLSANNGAKLKAN